jgi:hypothetical protein
MEIRRAGRVLRAIIVRIVMQEVVAGCVSLRRRKRKTQLLKRLSYPHSAKPSQRRGQGAAGMRRVTGIAGSMGAEHFYSNVIFPILLQPFFKLPNHKPRK